MKSLNELEIFLNRAYLIISTNKLRYPKRIRSLGAIMNTGGGAGGLFFLNNNVFVGEINKMATRLGGNTYIVFLVEKMKLVKKRKWPGKIKLQRPPPPRYLMVAPIHQGGPFG